MTTSTPTADAEQLAIPAPRQPHRKPPPSPKMSTAALEEALHAHFIKPEDRLSAAGAGAVYLTEVTAPGSDRRADVVHLGLWQSRGAGSIDVCELKTSRADFRRELAQPAKAEAWWPYSTRFWIVSPGEDITPPDELPDGWGLMVPKPNSRRFRVVVKPAERTPKLTMPLLLTLLKNTETTRTNALRQRTDQLQREHYEALNKQRRDLASSSDPKTRKRLELLDQLEAAMGMKLDEYSWRQDSITPEDAAAALRQFVGGHAALTEARRDLKHRAAELDRVSQALAEQAAAIWRAVAETPAGP